MRAFLFLVSTGSVLLTLAQGPVLTLTPTDFNGFNISCSGARDGAIDASVSGGTPPYSYAWSNGETTEDISSLAAGYYKVTVTDANSATGDAEITLVEPVGLKVSAEPFTYPSGHNISCNECFNGSVDVSVFGGVEPYAYLWSDDVTSQDRSGLGAMKYYVEVTDANECATRSETVLMTQPERDTWDRGGNAGTDPSTQFLGTTDAQDFILKSNGQERFRIKANGDFSLLGGSSTAGTGVLYRMPNGTLKLGGWPPYPPDPPDLCHDLSAFPFWETRGNTFLEPLCNEPLLGTMSNHDLQLVANGEVAMVLATNGKVGIGTYPPSSSTYRLFVEDGIATRDVLLKLGNWPDYVFDEGYRLMPLSELRAFLRSNKHLPTMLSAAQLEGKGGFEVGDIQRRLVRTAEEMALYILELEEKQEVLESRDRGQTLMIERLEKRLSAMERHLATLKATK